MFTSLQFLESIALLFYIVVGTIIFKVLRYIIPDYGQRAIEHIQVIVNLPSPKELEDGTEIVGMLRKYNYHLWCVVVEG